MNDELIEQLLRDGESACLDYKQDQYPFAKATDDQKSELLKDILTFANRWGHSVAYILIGVEEAKGAPSIVHGVTEHIPDNDLQQFVNAKTNRPVTFSYTVYPFEGKLVGVIEIAEQERPIYLSKNFGKLEKEAVYYRQGTSTAKATPDDVKKMGASAVGKKHAEAQRGSDEKEQVRVKLGVGFPTGLYADVYNSGRVPVYIKRVALAAGSIDETQDPPFQEMTRSIPLLTTIKLPVADGRGAAVHVTMGPQNSDIDPRREVRFVLPRYPSAFLENFIKQPETIWLSIETYGGEISRESVAPVVPLVVEFIKLLKSEEEAAKPKIVNLYTGEGYLVREGTVTIEGKDRRREIAVASLVDGFALSEEEQVQLIQELIADRVSGRIGKYHWRLGE